MRAASEYLASGRLDEALRITSRLVEVEPDGRLERALHAQVLLTRALADRSPGRGDALLEAAVAHEEALRLDPTHPGLAHMLGVTLDAAGRLQEALAAFERASALDPANPLHHFHRGTALRRLGREPEAREALQLAASLDPDDAMVRVALAEVLLRLNQTAEALSQARLARHRAPRELQPRIIEARVLRALDRPLEAAESLAALDASRRADEAVATELAAALRALDRVRDAAEAWELALRADPTRWRCALGAAEAWLDAGDLIRANERLLMAAALAPAAERETSVRALEERLRAASIERSAP